MTLVTLGLRPSLHAAARKMADRLPVSLAALYAKVKRTEPALLRALVRGSAQRRSPAVAGLEVAPGLPGWQLRIIDGNHLPASDKRLAPRRGLRGAALPGHTVVVYDPDSALVCDIVACEDAYESERAAAAELIESAQPGQAWIGDRHFCTEALLRGLQARGAGFIVREHSKHPRLQACGPWSKQTPTEAGRVREGSRIAAGLVHGARPSPHRVHAAQRGGFQRGLDREVLGARGGQPVFALGLQQGRIRQAAASVLQERADMVEAWIDGRTHVPKLVPEDVTVPVLSPAV